MRVLIRRISLALMALLLAGGAALWWVGAYLDTPLDLREPGHSFEVVRGNSLTAVATRLADAGVLRHPRILSAYGRVSGLAERVQAGEYELQPGTTPASLLRQLVDGRVRLHDLTILEGWTVRDLLAAVAQHPQIEHTLDVESPEQLARVLDLGYPHAEGWFFPDTYRFPRGTTDVDLLGVAHELMRQKLDEAWANRNPGTILTDPYEALILASIVERESALATERPLIAGVFLRRLERGMRLQTDPSVIYGLGARFDGNLTRRHLSTDGPYNTYTRRGLPPTPIALPGQSALRAAVNPDSGNALYFVATGRGDGSHFFTETLDEHNAAVARYLAELRRRRND
ncbi:MAG: endolytic transglycosylase MltG [Gammaproteobacteria bacterium]